MCGEYPRDKKVTFNPIKKGQVKASQERKLIEQFGGLEVGMDTECKLCGEEYGLHDGLRCPNTTINY